MYHIAACFDVHADRRQEFIDAALKDGRDSLAQEPGTKRFELIVDKENPNRFYLNEAYDDEAAFGAHVRGPHFKTFFDSIGWLAVEGPRVLEGTRIDITVTGTPEQGAVIAQARELISLARKHGYRVDELVRIIQNVA
jgi:autoinducer 2-degrading protein